MQGRSVRRDNPLGRYLPGCVALSLAALAPMAASAIEANAGADQELADTDQVPGEQVTLRGAASVPPITIHIPPGHLPDPGQCRVWFPEVPPGRQQPASPCGQFAGGVPAGALLLGNSVLTYRWLNASSQPIAAGATASVRLPDGEHLVTLLATDATGQTATDIVRVRVGATAPSTTPGTPGTPGTPSTAVGALRANAGADRNVPDSDAAPGEAILLDGTASTNTDGPIAIFQWFQSGQAIATGPTANVRLPDGGNAITLVVFDERGNSAAANVRITVGRVPADDPLSQLPNLTPNQRRLADALDSLCPRLRTSQASLVEDQRDLLVRCEGIGNGSAGEQTRALDEIAPEELNAISSQTFNLARLQLVNVADRLIALRAGAEGLNLTGLSLDAEGTSIPVDSLLAGVGALLGGGASADPNKSKNSRALADHGVGMWLRGNYGSGSKASGAADQGFRTDGWGVMGGIDYRISAMKVLGIAAGYGQSDATFNPIGSGTLDTRAKTAAVYATMYNARGLYFDAIASYLQADYDSLRRMFFTERASLVDLAAQGTTRGATMSASLNVGLDQSFHGFTVASNFGAHYMTTSIDAFREHGAGGLDLEYEQQDYTTAAVSTGLRLSYAVKTDIGTFIPQVRGEFIHELSDTADEFRVGFANDPFEDSPSIVIEGEVPDQSYWRLAAGVSAQLRHGLAGFLEYQRVQSHLHIDYTDILFGLRFESSFE